MAAAGVIAPGRLRLVFLEAHDADRQAAGAQQQGDGPGRQDFHGFAQDGI
jgi:hypothetical protein